MYLTDLADVARRTGFPVIEVSGWRTRGHGGQSDVKTIVCHHTAGPATGNYPSLGVVRDGRPGLSGPLAHFGLARDGTIYVIAAGRCYHAGVVRDGSYANEHAIGIEAEGTGVDSWPDVQMAAYRALCGELVTEYGLSVDRVLGHKEVCSPVGRKSDPNFSMPAFRASVTDYLNGADMPLSDADVAKVVAALTPVVRAEVAKVAPAVWRQPLTNGHDKTTAQAAAWVVYGNEASHAAVDAARSSATDSAAAVRAAILAGTVKVDISVNGAPQ